MENSKLNTQEINEEQDGGISKEQQLKLLENSFEMYEMSRREAIEERSKRKDKNGYPIFSQQSTKETIELMDTMQEDVIRQYVQLGGKMETLAAIRAKKPKLDRKRIADAIQNVEANEEKSAEIKKIREKQEKRRERKENHVKSFEEEAGISYDYEQNGVRDDFNQSTLKGNNGVEQYVEKSVYEIPEPKEIKEKDSATYNDIKPKASYDTVTLPSKGECYRNKVKEIKVSHLVAYDENLILSPSLYRNGTFLDHILKNKILDDINPDDLIQGDRDAIIIWLRAGGYGNEYPIRMTDDKSGKEFETVVDLSQLKFKKFDLKGDEDGYFDFTLPISKDVIKFRFLTNGDVKKLEKMRENENVAEKVTAIKNSIREIRTFIEDSERFNEEDSKNALDGLSITEDEIYDKFEEVPETYYTHDLTNRLIMSTVSINGNSDRKYVANYVVNMNLRDASEYRKYIVENEPGIDYNIKVKRPDSLGGGYIDTFLQLDQFIFVY